MELNELLKYYGNVGITGEDSLKIDLYSIVTNAYNNGVKWQQERSYSEEELYMLLQNVRLKLKSGVQKWKEDFEFDLDNWFEQFKKK